MSWRITEDEAGDPVLIVAAAATATLRQAPWVRQACAEMFYIIKALHAFSIPILILSWRRHSRKVITNSTKCSKLEWKFCSGGVTKPEG